jgi:hypothetical protein
MKRLLTLTTTGLFATGLAILPATVFAQSSPPIGADAKAGTSSHGVTGDTKVAPGSKDGAAMKDLGKVTTPKPGTAPAGAAKTTGNHDKGA